MTSGIYLLTFEDLPYIGQSQNIEQRYFRHLNLLESGKHVSKLQNAYYKYGKPELTILEEIADPSIINEQEIYYINFFDSINRGLNTCEGNSPPVLKGIDNGRSKYKKEQIVEVFKLLADPIYPYKTISKLTGVSHSMVKNISSGQNHVWMQNEFPEIYNTFIKNRKYRLEF